jgi:hypothetical protein
LQQCLSCHVFQGPRSTQPNFSQKCKFSLIHISSNMMQHTWSPSNIVCRVCLSVLSTQALITALKQLVLRIVCKVCLEGRGNSDWRKIQSLGPHFRMDRAHAFPLKHHIPPVSLCLLFLTAVAMNLELNTFKEGERVCIRG